MVRHDTSPRCMALRKLFNVDDTEKLEKIQYLQQAGSSASDWDRKGGITDPIGGERPTDIALLERVLTMQNKMLEKLDRRMESLENKLDSVMMHEVVHDGGGVVDNGLPTGWSAHKDENSGQIFYQHDRSGRVQWERPQEMSTL